MSIPIRHLNPLLIKNIPSFVHSTITVQIVQSSYPRLNEFHSFSSLTLFLFIPDTFQITLQNILSPFFLTIFSLGCVLDFKKSCVSCFLLFFFLRLQFYLLCHGFMLQLCNGVLFTSDTNVMVFGFDGQDFF